MNNLEPTDGEDGLLIESPVSLIPDLSLWGLEIVDEGVVEDSYDNRRILRENAARWLPVYTAKGHPTNLIQVVTVAMRQAQLSANKSIILKDQKNLDSDFKTGFDLVIIPQSDHLVPAWVIAATHQWNLIEEERQRRGPEGKLYRPALGGPPSRCRAKTISRHRCQNWADGRVEANGLCRTHQSNHQYDSENPGIHTLAKARARLLSASAGAVDGLEELALTATSEPVRLGAYKEILDRAGLRGGFDIGGEVKVQVVPAATVVQDRLDALRTRQIEMATAEAAERQAREDALTIDAEIVED